MHIISNRIYGINSYIARQQAVKLISQLLTIYVPIYFKVCRHPTCMHTSVSTSCTDNTYFHTQNHRQGLLQLLLYRVAIRLYLPTMIIGSVVCELYKISTHQFLMLLSSFIFFELSLF